jgi:hypothetical protein
MNRINRRRLLVSCVGTLGLFLVLAIKLLDWVDIPPVRDWFRGWLTRSLPSSAAAPARGERPAAVDVVLDREDRTYVRGETVRLKVTPAIAGTLHVFVQGPADEITCVRPPTQQVVAGQVVPVEVPVAEPFGAHRLIVVVSAEATESSGADALRAFRARQEAGGARAAGQAMAEVSFCTVDPAAP